MDGSKLSDGVGVGGSRLQDDLSLGTDSGPQIFRGIESFDPPRLMMITREQVISTSERMWVESKIV
jgi:hypothetical protein